MDSQFLSNAGTVAAIITALVAPVVRWCWLMQAEINKGVWERQVQDKRISTLEAGGSSSQEILSSVHTRVALLERAIERQSEILRRIEELSEKLNNVQSSIASLKHHEQNH